MAFTPNTHLYLTLTLNAYYVYLSICRIDSDTHLHVSFTPNTHLYVSFTPNTHLYVSFTPNAHLHVTLTFNAHYNR